MAASLHQRLAAECTGSAMLLATVIGSGVMGERMAAGVEALALLGNTLATGAMLVVLITMFGPVSGAHFNPAVTAALAARRSLTASDAAWYVLASLQARLSASSSRTRCSTSPSYSFRRKHAVAGRKP
jgi:glycerol uptake facilitator-like aquaporin